jgi:hypothetical protein
MHALLHRSEVCVITTSLTEGSIRGQLLGLLGPVQWLEVNTPTRNERREVLAWFAQDHPSFAGMDFDMLADLSNGISRYELVAAGRESVEEAYRSTLHANRHHMVAMEDMLVQLSLLLDPASEQYKRIEDAAAAQFGDELDSLL